LGGSINAHSHEKEFSSKKKVFEILKINETRWFKFACVREAKSERFKVSSRYVYAAHMARDKKVIK
jgi:hypothetical protein